MLFLYQKQIKGEKFPDLEKLLETTKWEPNRLGLALDYLKNKGCLKVLQSLGNYQGIPNTILLSVTNQGIDIVEDKKEFQRTFSFTVNLGLISFSWGAIER